ncbi:hypothetical protein O0L34_g11578 [Tuta absoluta]|nr:hypothetical protein O0L34_g11578 [Tuta absoluta]
MEEISRVRGPGGFSPVRNKKISKGQQNKLISLMKNFSPPGGSTPRSKEKMKYCSEFWTRAAAVLNKIESDPRHWKNTIQWRQVWSNYTTRVRRKITTKQVMSIFQEQVACILRRLENSNIQLEDENCAEVTGGQQDVNETGITSDSEDDNRPARIQNKRRKTVAFAEQASTYQARTIQTRPRTPHNHNQVNAYNLPVASTSQHYLAPCVDQLLKLRNQVKIEPLEQVSDNNRSPSPSQSQASTMVLEPDCTHQHGKTLPSTSRGYGNLSPNRRYPERDEINRKLVEANQMGLRLAKDLELYNQHVISITETFQHFSRQEQERQSGVDSTYSVIPPENLADSHQNDMETNGRPSISLIQVPPENRVTDHQTQEEAGTSVQPPNTTSNERNRRRLQRRSEYTNAVVSDIVDLTF